MLEEKTYVISEIISIVMNRRMDTKCAAGEHLDGKEEHVIINEQTGDPCYLVAESLSELCPVIMWKTELTSYELEYLDKEISK